MKPASCAHGGALLVWIDAKTGWKRLECARCHATLKAWRRTPRGIERAA